MAAFAAPIMGMVGDLLGGFLGSNTAKNAAGVEAGTFGRNAEQLAQEGLGEMKKELQTLSPYLTGGANSFNTLASLLGTPGQGLLQGYGSFQAPTLAQAYQDPGLQFQMQMGEQALQNSAAARGDLFSGNTLAALEQFGQGLGASSYQDVYNRALQNYGTNANTFYANQANQYNRLMGTAGMGLQAGGMANQARQFYTDIYDQAMNMSNQGGAAKAAGIVGSGNAWQGALGGMLGNGMSLASLLQGAGGGGSPYFGQMSPGQISGAYGGPTQVPTYSSPDTTPWQLTASGYGGGY